MGIGFPEFPAFPSLSDEGFSKTPGTVADFNDNLRLCLDGLGVEKADEYSSHSAKATLLSMASGFGLSKSTREALGYHVGRSSKDPVDVYSRGRLEEPVNELVMVLGRKRQIEAQKDMEDGLRGAQVAIPADLKDKNEDGDAIPGPFDDTSDDDSLMEELEPEKDSDDDVNEDAIASARPLPDPERMLFNKFSMRLHMGRKGSNELAVCGNSSPNFIEVPSDFSKGTKCKICFK